MGRFWLFSLWLFFAATCAGYASPAEQSEAGSGEPFSRAGFDVLKYYLAADFFHCYLPPYPGTFSATEVVTVRPDSVLSSIQLDADSRSIRVDSVGLAGVSFSHSANILTVRLDRNYTPGETVSIRISYRHQDAGGTGFYVTAGYVFTDSPPEGARTWFPCRDIPSDKATWELRARVPVSARLGSTGMLADSAIEGDTLVYHWISDIPVSTYLITITSSVEFLIHTLYWHKLSNPGDSIPVRIYYKPGENLRIVDSLITPLTNFYSEKFGDYPFEKIGFATLNSAFPWGGMENQGMVNFRPGAYSNPGLIAHEHAHQWFGDLITCGTWADVWLNEGFGTYCQNLWLEHSSGQMAYKRNMNFLADFYLAHNPGWPVYHPEWAVKTPGGNELYNQAITYNKGACVLYQLRYILGDSMFFRVLHEYATDRKFMFSNAVTTDFIEKACKVSGQDLNWFFNEWIYLPDHPVYRNVYTIDSLEDNRWRLTLIIDQVQANSGFFKMPVEIRISFTDGTDTIGRFMNDENLQNFTFTFDREPVSLEFDPFRNILLKEAETTFEK